MAQTKNPPISIYPNPFVDSVTYHIAAKYGDSLELRIYDIQGRLRLNFEKQPFYKTQTISLNVESINNGVYIISSLVDSTRFDNKILKNGGASNIQLELEIAVKPRLTDELTIYPNPTNAELHVLVKSTSPKVDFSLCDLEGTILIKEEIVSENGLIKWDMNLAHLSNGIYIIHTKSNTGERSERIVKGIEQMP